MNKNIVLADFEEITDRKLLEVKRDNVMISNGSDVSCYSFENRSVIKIFNDWCDLSNKLFLSHDAYKNNTYPFVNAVQKNRGKIVSYTMPHIRTLALNKNSFDVLSYDTLDLFLKKAIHDSKKIANDGIFTFDTYISNIRINKTGFKVLDPIDFLIIDKDPDIIQRENVSFFGTAIWDHLFTKNERFFCVCNKLSKDFLCENPDIFFQELLHLSEELSDTEILTVADTKKLIKSYRR